MCCRSNKKIGCKTSAEMELSLQNIDFFSPLKFLLCTVLFFLFLSFFLFCVWIDRSGKVLS